MSFLPVQRLSPKLKNASIATLTAALGTGTGVGFQRHKERSAKGVRSYMHPGEREHLTGLAALATSGALLGGAGFYVGNHPQFPIRRGKSVLSGGTLGLLFGSSLLAGTFLRSLLSGRLPTNNPAPPPRPNQQRFAQATAS